MIESNRRHFLKAVLSSAVIGVAEQGVNLAASEELDAQATLTPDAALQQLVAGNHRFAAKRDLTVLRERTVEKQEPFAAVLACADSRVPVELIFDQTIGGIFVTRIAGNIVTPEIIASLEYGVAELGVRTVVVLGHSNCGAVKAAMKGDTVPGQISVLYQGLRRAVEQSNGVFEKAVELNSQIQADLLRTSSTVIRDAVKAGKLKVGAAVYDLSSGKITLS